MTKPKMPAAFDVWMRKQNPKYVPSDDTVALCLLRACWAESRKQATTDCAEHLAKVSSQAQANLIRWMT